MKTSWIETRTIEQAITAKALPEDLFLHEAKRIAVPEYAARTELQKKTYTILKKYHRKQLRAELDTVFGKLMDERKDNTFRARIMRLFA
ncbi:MAG: hypothetical protein INR69_00795 [Mucilaginibacter polytrichastri]|nr:hypothetical protein [Mucilaginibacter polytrichastri]